MAQINSGFVTGARAKIVIGSRTMAYASDVSYNITIQTIPIETMGKYEVHTNEPVAYNVDGSFSVVRYTAKSSDNSAVVDQTDNGNAPADNANSGGTLEAGTAPGNHLDPAKILSSSSFDLEIKEKAAGAQATDTSVFRINDCRITRRGATLNKRGVLVDNYAFVAVLAGDADEASGNIGVASSGMDKDSVDE